MRRRRGSSVLKEKARKKVAVKLIERKHAGQIAGPYRIMEKLIKDHHPHLADAKIAIAWRYGWKANADGVTTLGQAKKGSDLDRELHDHDFVILLNHERWNSGTFSESQMHALMDHELCHCEISKDVTGEPKTDERGRVVYRIRKHDIEEFKDVVARHGQWKGALEKFAEAMANKTSRPLLDKLEESDPPTGKNGKVKK